MRRKTRAARALEAFEPLGGEVCAHDVAAGALGVALKAGQRMD